MYEKIDKKFRKRNKLFKKCNKVLCYNTIFFVYDLLTIRNAIMFLLIYLPGVLATSNQSSIFSPKLSQSRLSRWTFFLRSLRLFGDCVRFGSPCSSFIILCLHLVHILSTPVRLPPLFCLRLVGLTGVAGNMDEAQREQDVSAAATAFVSFRFLLSN